MQSISFEVKIISYVRKKKTKRRKAKKKKEEEGRKKRKGKESHILEYSR